MTGAVATASPAAPAAGNASLLSAGVTPPPDTLPATPDTNPNSGNGNRPVTPDTPPVVPPAENDPGADPAKDDGPDEGEEGAPEQYAFEAPEGVVLDPAAVEEFTPVARELGLTQAQAQRLVGVVAGMQQRQAEAQAEQVRQWAEETMADKEIGGRHWEKNALLVREAKDRFATPGLLDLMNSTGLGNHPEVIKLFVRLGREVADDGHVIGGRPGPEPHSAESFYAKMPKLEGAR
jgi:hypothetical protein